MSNKTKAELEKETVQQRAQIKVMRRALDDISLLHYADPMDREQVCVECGGGAPCKTKRVAQEARKAIKAAL